MHYDSGLSYVSQRVREVRGNQSLRDFSKKCGLSHAYLRKIEHGISRGKPLSITLSTLGKLMRAGVIKDYDRLIAAILSEGSTSTVYRPLSTADGGKIKYKNGGNIVENTKDLTIDELGRVLLPRNLREKLNWSAKDAVSVSVNTEDNTVILRLSEKHQSAKCMTCGTLKALAT